VTSSGDPLALATLSRRVLRRVEHSLTIVTYPSHFAAIVLAETVRGGPGVAARMRFARLAGVAARIFDVPVIGTRS
jgi:hypothetical protein